MLTLHLDFETYSELDVRSVGSSRYAEHPSTEVLCLGWAVDDEEPRLWRPGLPPPRRLFERVAEGWLPHAWGAGFEIAIWRRVCRDRMGWPGIPLSRWRDAAAVALSFALPANLEDAGAALGLDVVKDPRGKHLVRKLSKPRRPSKRDPSTRWTPESVPNDFAGLYAYCLQDVRSERAVLDALPCRSLPARELAIWRNTVELNLRGWSIDAGSVRAVRALLSEHQALALEELRRITEGEVQTVSQVDRILRWLRSRGVRLANLRALTVQEALGKELPDEARRVLEIRQVLGKSSTAKYDAMVARVCADGTVKDNLLYHGASTGRDAGRGLQIQNMVRKPVAKGEEAIEEAIRTLRADDPLRLVECLYGSVPDYASRLGRSMLVAAPRHVLYCADYSSIENRVTVVLAGSEYGMQIFRDGLDQYRMAAVKHYGVDYEDVTGPQRDHMKRAVLLCCFGGSWKSYVQQAKLYGVEGSQASKKVAQETIRSYREDLYPEVPRAWYDLETAAQEAVVHGRPTRFSTRYATIRFRCGSDFLFMTLPSGRRLAYYRPEVRMMKTWWGVAKPTLVHLGVGLNHRWTELKLIPGRIFENAVQAMARDIMMNGALAVRAAGYLPVGRVHDEVVSQRREGTGSLEEYLELMCTPVPWFQGVPIEADGWVGHRYRKG